MNNKIIFKEDFIVNSIAKKILNWNEERFNNIDTENDRHPLLKSFGCGVVEGFIDSAVMFYIPMIIVAYVWKHKALKK